jgi:hypothetical protein
MGQITNTISEAIQDVEIEKHTLYVCVVDVIKNKNSFSSKLSNSFSLLYQCKCIFCRSCYEIQQREALKIKKMAEAF